MNGYARYTAKPAADVVLQIESEMKDPLYVRWQYGLGKAAVFASDAKSRWAAHWIGWPGFDSFWVNATRDLLSHIKPDEASASFDQAKGEIVATYRSPTATPPQQIPSIYVLGPNGYRQVMRLRSAPGGVWQGTVAVGDRKGLFRLTADHAQMNFPELGVYRGADEAEVRGVNEPLLRQIAASTRGRFNPPPASVFEYEGPPAVTRIELWPLLIGLAIALTIVELVVRKWTALGARFGRKAAALP